MRAVDIIRKKRDAAELSREEIAFLIDGATHDRIPDYQLAAFLMAVLWRGMTRAELAALTESMLNSGRSARLVRSSRPQSGQALHRRRRRQNFPGHRSHRRGGRTLRTDDQRPRPGHTGGTLDKLESIPGFNVNLQLDEFRRALAALRPDRPDARNRAGRQKTLRSARRHRHSRKPLPDHRLHHEQKNGGGN